MGDKTTELREQIEHVLTSAYQDGFGALRHPEYRNRTVEHTQSLVRLFDSRIHQAIAEMEGLKPTYPNVLNQGTETGVRAITKREAIDECLAVLRKLAGEK